MKTSQNTVLITGGSAGIGFEIAKQLSAKNNHVIIVGRNAERLEKAAGQLQNATAITADIADAADVDKLVSKLNSDFPALNMVINNAGYATLNSIVNDDDIFDKAGAEMHTNYLSVIRLNQKLLPLLQKQQESAIVNVSSIVAFVPGSAFGMGGYLRMSFATSEQELMRAPWLGANPRRKMSRGISRMWRGHGSGGMRMRMRMERAQVR